MSKVSIKKKVSGPREIVEQWIKEEEKLMKDYEKSFSEFDNIEDDDAAKECEAKIAAWNDVLCIL